MEIAADGTKGINCDSLVYITGGRTTIINTATSRIETDSLGNEVSTGAAGVKADYNMTMTGGTLNIKCTGNDAKGINVAQPFLFKGGELNVVCTGVKTNVSPKGVKCDTDCTISGGSFYSCAPEGKAIDVDGVHHPQRHRHPPVRSHLLTFLTAPKNNNYSLLARFLHVQSENLIDNLVIG